MKFKLSIINKDLIEAVEFASKVAEKKANLEILTHLYFSFLADGSLSIIGGDLENELEYRLSPESFEIDADVKDLKFTITSSKLLMLLKSAPSDCKANISNTGKVDEDFKFTLTFSGIKSRHTMNGFSPDDYPCFNIGTKKSALFEITTLSFLSLTLGVHHAMANKDVRYFLNGLKISGQSENLSFTATDGHRLATHSAPYVNKINAEEFNAILPRKLVSLFPTMLAKTDEEMLTCALSENHFMAKFSKGKNTLVVKSKLIDGRFPDTERVTPKHFTQCVSINRQALLNSVNRTSILSNEKFHGLDLTFNEKELKLQCSNPLSETAVESIEIEESEPLTIGVNVKYLVAALSSYTTETVTLNLNDRNTAIVINSEDSPNHINVVMPMRL